MGLTEPAVNPATSCQFQEYFYRDAGMAPGWPEAKIRTQCAWHDHGEQIDSKGPLLLGEILMSSELTPATATLSFSELMPATVTSESGLAKATLNFWPKAAGRSSSFPPHPSIKSKMWKRLRGVGKLEGTQRAGWECRGPTICNISIKYSWD